MLNNFEQRVIEHVLEIYENNIDSLAHDRRASGGSAQMVEAGCFLCYYSDVREWWQGAGGPYIEEDNMLWFVYIITIANAVDEIINNRWRYEND